MKITMLQDGVTEQKLMALWKNQNRSKKLIYIK